MRSPFLGMPITKRQSQYFVELKVLIYSNQESIQQIISYKEQYFASSFKLFQGPKRPIYTEKDIYLLQLLDITYLMLLLIFIIIVF